jgi:hypothetical protein
LEVAVSIFIRLILAAIFMFVGFLLVAIVWWLWISAKRPVVMDEQRKEGE